MTVEFDRPYPFRIGFVERGSSLWSAQSRRNPSAGAGIADIIMIVGLLVPLTVFPMLSFSQRGGPGAMSIVGLAAGAMLALFLVDLIRTRQPASGFTLTISGSASLSVAGVNERLFRASELSLQVASCVIVDITAQLRGQSMNVRGYWCVVLGTPGGPVPLACVRSGQETEQYLESLPASLRAIPVTRAGEVRCKGYKDGLVGRALMRRVW